MIVATKLNVRIALSSRLSLPIALFVVAGMFVGCSQNPVTGEREFVPFSTAREIKEGKTYYGPTQQAQGGRYTANPSLEEYVKRVGRRVAKVSDRQLPYEFVVVNNGTPNAWALPGGKIAITRGLLLELENESELAAVLAHEVVHAAARHGARAMTRNLFLQVAKGAVGFGARKSKFANDIVDASDKGLQLVSRKYGRDAEREADRHGIRYMSAAGYDIRAAVTLQEKFLALQKGRKANWLKGLFATHPPSAERAKNNHAALAKFTVGGKVGRGLYDKALSDLRARQPAYVLADRARGEMDKEPLNALRLVDGAIAQEPREALFYGLKGQIQARRSQYATAVKAYNRAIKRDATYYKHFLGRGLAHDALGRRAQARRDLERSMELLPTALASHALGHIARAEGAPRRAKSLFAKAASARGEIGQAARKELFMLEVVDAPWRYVKTQAFLRNGQIVVNLTNKAPYPLADIAVRVVAKGKGKPRRRSLSLVNLAGQETVVLPSGIWHRGKDKVTVEAKVLRAYPVVTKAEKARPYRRYP